MWTVVQLGDSAYKITVPSVVYVAWLRARQNSVECASCGAMLHPGLTFCPECGAEMSVREDDSTDIYTRAVDELEEEDARGEVDEP